jgi:hypothetical protein
MAESAIGDTSPEPELRLIPLLEDELLPPELLLDVELVPLPDVAVDEVDCACSANGVAPNVKNAPKNQAALRRIFMVETPARKGNWLVGLYRLYRHPRRPENSKSNFSLKASPRLLLLTNIAGVAIAMCKDEDIFNDRRRLRLVAGRVGVAAT